MGEDLSGIYYTSTSINFTSYTFEDFTKAWKQACCDAWEAGHQDMTEIILPDGVLPGLDRMVNPVTRTPVKVSRVPMFRAATKDRLRITSTGPGRELVEIGGHMVPCSSVWLDMRAGHLPEVFVGIPIVEGMSIDLPSAVAEIDGDTHEALIRMGWTPPL